jgi:hypothetical protein
LKRIILSLSKDSLSLLKDAFLDKLRMQSWFDKLTMYGSTSSP